MFTMPPKSTSTDKATKWVMVSCRENFRILEQHVISFTTSVYILLFHTFKPGIILRLSFNVTSGNLLELFPGRLYLTLIPNGLNATDVSTDFNGL